MFEPRELPPHLSYSQWEKFLDCGEKYRLERVYKVPQQPSYALVGGKTIHLASELIDKQLEPVKTDGSWSSGAHMLSLPQQTEEGSRTQTPTGDGESLRDQRHVHMKALLQETVSQADWTAVGENLRDLNPGDVEVSAVPQPVWEVWNLAFSAEILAEMNHNQFFPDPKDWASSGRTSKASPDGEDLQWWSKTGPSQLASYISWRMTSGWQMAYFKGSPMIELDIAGKIGETSLQAFLDRIMIDPFGRAVIVDLKSSKAEPTDPLQLGVYKILLESIGMPAPVLGAYFMTRTGTMGKLRDLSHYTSEYLGWQFGNVQALRDQGIFLANTKSKYCYSCKVKPWCYAENGAHADEIPRPWAAKRLPLSVA